ncbi:MAG TPA: hypothetical protein VF268_10585, partial [Gammaproteobacteria bacterium]
MLKLRVVTIVVLAPLAVAAILWLPNDLFSYLLMIFFAVGAYEWGRLAGFPGALSLVVLIGFLLIVNSLQQYLHLQSWIYWLAAG